MTANEMPKIILFLLFFGGGVDTDVDVDWGGGKFDISGGNQGTDEGVDEGVGGGPYVIPRSLINILAEGSVFTAELK